MNLNEINQTDAAVIHDALTDGDIDGLTEEINRVLHGAHQDLRQEVMSAVRFCHHAAKAVGDPALAARMEAAWNLLVQAGREIAGAHRSMTEPA